EAAARADLFTSWRHGRRHPLQRDLAVGPDAERAPAPGLLYAHQWWHHTRRLGGVHPGLVSKAQRRLPAHRLYDVPYERGVKREGRRAKGEGRRGKGEERRAKGGERGAGSGERGGKGARPAEGPSAF